MPVLEVSVPIAHELLAQCVRQGEALVQRASLVGDFSDYESWKAARNQWIEPTVQALDHMYGGSPYGDEFSEAATVAGPPQRWQEQYAADLKAVKAAIELLRTLQGDLAFVRDEPMLAAGAARSAADGWAQAKLNAPELGPEQRAASAAPGEPSDGADASAIAGGGDAPEGSDAQRLAPDSLDDELSEPTRRRAPDADATEQELRLRDVRDPDSSSVGAELAPATSLAPELAQLANGAVSTEHAGSPQAPGASAPAPTKQVLLAHGRNDHWMQAVAELLEHAGPHDVTVLNERSGEQSRLSEQVGEQAHRSRYAIVLLTADDIGARRVQSEDEPYFSPRAHQAVVFEMGFLVAALAPGRVCVLYEEGVQLPCDLEGIAYVRLDIAGTWQPKLLLALRKAGFDYDVNKLAA
jgi:predicted nucleotide-binding protein